MVGLLAFTDDDIAVHGGYLEVNAAAVEGTTDDFAAGHGGDAGGAGDFGGRGARGSSMLPLLLRLSLMAARTASAIS